MGIKLLVFCILFGWHFAVSAQSPKPNLVAFTDYAKCTYGLKNPRGKQIWKAEFTVLEQVSLKIDQKSTRFFWIAEKNGLVGALNDSGVVIIPFQYQELLFSQTAYFIARRREAMEVHSLSGEIKYLGVGLEEIHPLKNGYFVIKNGQTGFLDLQFQERIPMSFSQISPAMLYQHYDSNAQESSSRIFHIHHQQKTGIYDLNQGLVVPCDYEFVEIHWANQYCSESQGVYLAYQGDKRYVFNSQGDLLDSLSRNEYLEVYQVPLDSCASKAKVIGFIATHAEQEGGFCAIRMLNFQTHEKSKEYDFAHINGDRMLCKSGKTWVVLDEHFQEIKHWSKWIASWQFVWDIVSYSSSNSHIRNSYIPQIEFNPMLQNNQCVFIYSNLKKGDQTERPNVGLYNYMLDKRIDPKYRQISELEFKGKEVYWAFKVSKENQKYEGSEMGPLYSQLDIYDDQLNLLRTFKGNGIPLVQNHPKRDLSNALFFQKTGNYYGAVNCRGEQVIPAKYKEIGEFIFNKSASQESSETYYLFGNDQFALFNGEGKQIIPEKHTQYQSLGAIVIARNVDRTYAVYTITGNLLLDDVTSYFVARSRNSFTGRECSYLRNDQNPAQDLIFFVKGEQLFYLQDEVFLLADSETFDFRSTYLQLSATIIVDQNAKVVDTKGIKWRKWYSKCPLEHAELPIQSDSPPVKKNPKVSNNLSYQWERTFDPKSKKDPWILKDRSGRRLSSRVFDYPFNPESQAGKIFRVDGKYGLMLEDFKELLAPEYDYIFPVKDGFVLYKQGLWKVYNLKRQVFSPDNYDVISTYDWDGKRLVFKNGKVGVLIDSSASYLVPLTDSIAFLRKVNLFQLLDLDKRDAFYLKTNCNLVLGVKPDQVYRQINNGQLVWHAYQRSTLNDFLEIHPVDRNFLDNHSRIFFQDIETVSTKKPVVTTPYYYTEEVESYHRTLYDYYKMHSYDGSTSVFYNYKIVNGRLIPIQLKDIITNALVMKKLDDLLIQKLNEAQYFGQNCTDIVSKIECLKANVLITESGLRFQWPDYPKFEFEIYFNRLSGILSKEFQKQVSGF